VDDTFSLLKQAGLACYKSKKTRTRISAICNRFDICYELLEYVDMKNKNKRQTIPESKHDRFVRVVERRTNESLDRIRVLGNCSNRNTYSYTDEEVTAVFLELERALKTARTRFQQPQRKRFRLSPERKGATDA
jgi:hypothetical protein